MRRIMYLLLAVLWLAMASGDGWAAGKTPAAGKTNRVSRPAGGVSRPAELSRIVSPQEHRRVLKARMAHINKKFAAIQKRIEKVQDQKLRRALRLRLEILREKVITRLRATPHKHHRLPRKR